MHLRVTGLMTERRLQKREHSCSDLRFLQLMVPVSLLRLLGGSSLNFVEVEKGSG